MQLLLSQDEYEFLTELLEQTRRDLRGEVHKTASHDFRIKLQKKQRILESLLTRLSWKDSWKRPEPRLLKSVMLATPVPGREYYLTRSARV